MIPTDRKSRKIAYVSVVASIASLLGAALLLLAEMDDRNINIILSATVILAVAVLTYFFALRSQKRLNRAVRPLLVITQLLRDSVSSAYQVDELHRILEIEQETLRKFCEHVKSVVMDMIQVPCEVSIKLLTREDSKVFVRTDASTAERRRQPVRERVELNSEYLIALRPHEGQRLAYFFSPDLTVERSYMNQNPHWRDLYRSVLVVPIRQVVEGGERTEDIGFLSVDTTYPGRLNDGEHLRYLYYFADQLYIYLMTLRLGIASEILKQKAEQLGRGDEL